VVPCAFAFVEDSDGLTVYSALDEKPKSVADPRDLARVRDIVARPRVTLLVDRWSEDWTDLAWLRLEGTATLLEPTDSAAAEHALAVGLLRARYPQYATHNLETRPMIRVAVERTSGWAAAGK
jgi:PPOX class probable F420-dependent enzyme